MDGVGRRMDVLISGKGDDVGGLSELFNVFKDDV